MPPAIRWMTPQALDGLLDRLVAEKTLVAPVCCEGEVVFRRVTRASEVCRDYVNSLVPPKEHFLPTPERLLSYRVRDGVPQVDGGDDAPRPAVIFGIRSCDVAGLEYLERFLSGEMFGRPDTADPAFMARRDAATLVSVVCRTPGDTCMCVCCKGGPALERGFDWQLTELAAGWLVEIGSPRGERLAGRCAAFLSDPPAHAARDQQAQVRETVARFGEHSTHRVQTMAATRMVSTGRLGEAFWARVGERCIECGGCSFVCPTCYCFNVADVNGVGEAGFEEPAEGLVPAVPGGITAVARDGTYARVRLRDCCILPGFVRQAGGGYPRWTCGERCLTRFFHKLSQQFQERMDAPGCTGCGRCIVTCMGGIGIDRIAEEMTDALVGQRRPRFGEPRVRPRAAAG